MLLLLLFKFIIITLISFAVKKQQKSEKLAVATILNSHLKK